MNCQDIARMLDEQEVDSLLAEERSAVQAHLAGCRDCARDWQVHAQLSGASIPAVPVELRALYAPQVRAGVNFGARQRNRFIMFGVFFAVAAAAAMFGVQLTASRAPIAAIADPAQVESRVMTVSSAAIASPGIEFRAEDPAQLPAKAVQQQVVAGASQTQLRIVLMPAQHDSQDNAAKPAIDVFHSSLLRALRNMPDVVVEVASPAPASDPHANRVTVVSPRVTTQTSGRPVYHSGNGRGTWQELMGTYRPYNGPARWPVQVMLEAARRPGNYSTVDQFIDSSGMPMRTHCSANLDMPVGASAASSSLTASPGEYPAMCASVEGLAAWLVAALRLQESTLVDDTAQLTARLSDTSGETEVRRTAYTELLRRAREDGLVLDAANLNAIAAYLRGVTSQMKASDLMWLRGIRQPGLIAPLLEALQGDADEKVRLQVLTTLVTEYSSDSRARAAFASVARQDASRFVRMVAQRPLSGDAQWQSYVVSTLADRSLSTTDRLAPVLYDIQRYPQGSANVQSILGTAEITRQLLELFQELRAASPRQPAADTPPGAAPPGVDLNIIPSNLIARMAELVGPEAGSIQVMRGSPDLPVAGASADINYGSGAVGTARITAITNVPEPQQPAAALVSVLAITNPSAATDLRIRILTEDPRPGLLTTSAITALLDKRDDPRVSKVLDDIAAGKSGQQLQRALENSMATRSRVVPQTNR